MQDFGISAAALDAQLLRRRREYIVAYQESLLADLGGAPLSKHSQMRLGALVRGVDGLGRILLPSSPPPLLLSLR